MLEEISLKEIRKINEKRVTIKSNYSAEIFEAAPSPIQGLQAAARCAVGQLGRAC
jgi:hypothetical protein